MVKIIGGNDSDVARERSDFPSLLGNVFQEAMPDLDALGIAAADQALVKQALAHVGGGLRGAMANLAGGKWGLAQFVWIPRAIEFELGVAIADAFRGLVDERVPVAERVDAFRDEMYAVTQALPDPDRNPSVRIPVRISSLTGSSCWTRASASHALT